MHCVGKLIPATGGGAAKHMVQVCIFTGVCVCIACLCVPSCISVPAPAMRGQEGSLSAWEILGARPQSFRREGALTKERAALSTYKESPGPFLGRAMSTRVWAA